MIRALSFLFFLSFSLRYLIPLGFRTSEAQSGCASSATDLGGGGWAGWTSRSIVVRHRHTDIRTTLIKEILISRNHHDTRYSLSLTIEPILVSYFLKLAVAANLLDTPANPGIANQGSRCFLQPLLTAKPFHTDLESLLGVGTNLTWDW